ncbi:SAV_915 family protein [Saccharopolyspora sp. SCSIO 74807]|uniref:SAV_915 family protein n=1 Tax=Saccharopolyspora sp. SCSIO 74807 TaxID=3118084 RepID=UPI0030D084CE
MAYGDRDVLQQHGDVAPSVIGPESVAPLDADEQLPETVYLPSERVTDRNAEVTLELRATGQGQIAMLAFTSLEELVAGCGNAQPWVSVRGHQVDELRSLSGADVVVWDSALPYEERKTQLERQKGNEN